MVSGRREYKFHFSRVKPRKLLERQDAMPSALRIKIIALEKKVVGERAFLVDKKVKYPIEVCSTPVMVTSLK